MQSVAGSLLLPALQAETFRILGAEIIKGRKDGTIVDEFESSATKRTYDVDRRSRLRVWQTEVTWNQGKHHDERVVIGVMSGLTKGLRRMRAGLRRRIRALPAGSLIFVRSMDGHHGIDRETDTETYTVTMRLWRVHRVEA